jgi:hypothetical protein
MEDSIECRESNHVPKDAVLDLYRANHWSSANKPDQLHQALIHSHSLVTAWDGERLVGLGKCHFGRISCRLLSSRGRSPRLPAKGYWPRIDGLFDAPL